LRQLGLQVRPRMILKLQRLLGASSVHPVCDEPVIIAVWITGPARWDRARYAQSRHQARGDFGVSQSVRIIAAYQQDLASDVGGGCRGKRPCDVANVDGL